MADKFSSRTFPVSFVTIMTERGGKGSIAVCRRAGKFLAGLMYAVVNTKHKCQLYEKQRTAGND